MNDGKVVLILEADQFQRLWQILELLETLLWEIRATNDDEEREPTDLY